jgi:hypothetical protein
MRLKDILNKISYIILGGTLWKLGGTYGGWYRSIGIPFVLAGICYNYTQNIIVSLITFVMTFIAITPGYGDSSLLRTFWRRIFNGNERWAKRMTRLCCGISYSMAYIPKLAFTQTYGGFAALVILPIAIVLLTDWNNFQDNEEVLIGATYIGLYLL